MKWHVRMSQFIENMTEESCLFYHRNYLQRFKSIEGIINHLQLLFYSKFQKLPE